MAAPRTFAPVLLAAGVMSAGWLAGCSTSEPPVAPVTTTDQAGRPTVITPSPSMPADPADPGSADEDTPSTELPWRRVTFADALGAAPGVAPVAGVEVPADWSVTSLPSPLPPPGEVGEPPMLVCLGPAPADARRLVDGCAGLLLAGGGEWTPGAGGAAYRPGQPDGWLTATDPVPCPALEIADEDAVPTPDSASATGQGGRRTTLPPRPTSSRSPATGR